MLNKTRFKRFTGKLLGSVVAFSMLGQSLTPIQIYGQDGVEDEFYEGDVGNGEDFATDESEMIPDNLPVIEGEEDQTGYEDSSTALIALQGDDSEESENDLVNPQFTLQHYVYFEAVARERNTLKPDDKNTSKALAIINTNPKVNGETVKSGTQGLDPYTYLENPDAKPNYIGKYWDDGGNATSSLSGGLPTNQYNWRPGWMIGLDENGELNTNTELVPMFADEKPNFLSKPAIQYMSLVYNTPEEANESYTLDEVWIQQPGDLNGATPGSQNFYKIDVPALKGNESGLNNPDAIQFTNNKNAVGAGNAQLPLFKIGDNNKPEQSNPNPTYSSGTIQQIGTEDDPVYLILIQPGTVVRLVYGIREGSQPKDATFFDYDITDGYIYMKESDAKNGENGQPTSSQEDYETVIGVTNRKSEDNRYGTFGINSSKNFESDINQAWLGFGNSNTGTGIGYFTWQDGGKANQLNKANRAEPNNPFYLTFGLSAGVNSDGSLKFASGVVAPRLFRINGESFEPKKVIANNNGHIDGQYLQSMDVQGKSMFNKSDDSGIGSDEYYSLVFKQDGGTYTLSSVNRHYGETQESGVPVVENLEKFDATVSKVVTNGTGTEHLGDYGRSKLGFWPMDAASTWGADGHDMKFGVTQTPGQYPDSGSNGSNKNQYYGINDSGNNHYTSAEELAAGNITHGLGTFPAGDDAYSHNSYFGMRYHEDFVLQPGYCAPLRYFFFGDDDMFVYLTDITEAYEYNPQTEQDVKKDDFDTLVSQALSDTARTKKISGVGGVHSSAGMYTDLWNFLTPLPYLTKAEEKALDESGNNNARSRHYRMSVFYDERGESGSTCYMRYTLPLEPLKTAERDYKGNLKIEKNVLSSRLDDPKEYEFNVKLFHSGSNGINQELVNMYNYKIYQKSTDPDKPDQEISKGQMQSFNKSSAQPAEAVAEDGTGDSQQSIVNGTFKLKDNRYVLIEGLVNGTRYAVAETNAGEMTTYAVGTINEGIQSAAKPLGKDSVAGSVDAEADDSQDEENKDKNYVLFYNVENPGRLSIEKQLNATEPAPDPEQSFTFRVKLTDKNGNPLPGKVGYTVAKVKKGSGSSQQTGSQSFTQEEEDSTEDGDDPDPKAEDPKEPSTFHELTFDANNEAQIQIKAGEVATIINLPEDAQYKVQEVLESNGGYTFESVDVQNSIDQSYVKDGAAVSGSIQVPAEGQEALTLVYTNRIGKPALTLEKQQVVVTEEMVSAGDVGFKNANKNNEPPMPVQYGNTVRYFLQVTNTGEQPQHNVVIKDSIPVLATQGDMLRSQAYIPGTAGSLVPDGQNVQIDDTSSAREITWTIAELAAGGSVIVYFDVLVPPVLQTTVWANTGTVTSKENPGSITSNTVRNEEPVKSDLGIVKSQYLDPTREPSLQEAALAQTEMLEVNGQSVIRYYLTIRNNTTSAISNVTIEDTIPVPAISPMDASPLEYLEGSARYVSGGVEYPDNLEPEVADGVIRWTFPSLEPEEEAIVSFDVMVPDVDVKTQWRNAGWVIKGDDPDHPIPSNPVDSEETPADLKIEKMQIKNPAGEPDQSEAQEAVKTLLTVDGKDIVRYYLKVTNTGQTDQTNVRVIEKLPVSVVSGNRDSIQKYIEKSAAFVAPQPASASVKATESKIIWTIPELQRGQSFYVCFDVEAPVTAETTLWRNVAAVTSTETPKEIPSNPVENLENPENPRPSGSLDLEKKQLANPSDDPSASQYNKAGKDQLMVKSGDVIRYYLKVTNTGSTIQNNVMIKDKIPVSVLSGDVWSVQTYIPNSAVIVQPKITDSSQGSVNVTASQILWKVNELDPKESMIVSFDVKVPSVSRTTTWKNQGTAVSDQEPEEVPSNPVYSDEPVVPGNPPQQPGCPVPGPSCPPSGGSAGGNTSNSSSNNTTNNTTNTTTNNTTNNTTTNGGRSPGTSRNLNLPFTAALFSLAAVGVGAAFTGMNKSKKTKKK